MFFESPIGTKEPISEDEFIKRWEGEVGATWFAKEKKPWVIEKVLKPIYARYKEMLEDIKTEGASENIQVEARKRLYRCLDVIARRLGATEVQNIILDLSDIERAAARYSVAIDDPYVEYAVKGFYEFT